jgi:hypothetical protein
MFSVTEMNYCNTVNTDDSKKMQLVVLFLIVLIYINLLGIN